MNLRTSFGRWIWVLGPLALGLLPCAQSTAQEPTRAFPERQKVPAGRIEIITTRRARLGVTVNLQAIESDSVGALIQGVTPNGPAARAGLRSGDIITRLNGKALVNTELRLERDASAPGIALTLMAAELNPGDTVTVQYLREGQRKNATLVAGAEPVWAWGAPDAMLPPEPSAMRRRSAEDVTARRYDLRVRVDTGLEAQNDFLVRTPRPRMFMLGSPLADLELAPINPQLGRYFKTTRGVLVIDVPRNYELGLQPGDVVFSVDGRDIVSPPHLLRVLQSYVGGEKFSMEIMREGKKRTVTGVLAER